MEGRSLGIASKDRQSYIESHQQFTRAAKVCY